jgi:uncharacterized membrane protein
MSRFLGNVVFVAVGVVFAVSCKPRSFDNGEVAAANSKGSGLKLVCSGTEPFWDFSLNGTTGTLKVPSKDDKVFSNLKQSALEGESAANGFVVRNSELTATIRKKACSNGMSEGVSEFAISFQGAFGFSGCCSRL